MSVFLWRDSIGNLDKVNLYCDVVEILWSNTRSGFVLQCRGNFVGIVPEVDLWRDVGARIQR
ncbi:TPA: hypothetical protein PQS85_000971 [Staphylococcus aureus]|nr:hypothetical protein [Staphylococcus aureus]